MKDQYNVRGIATKKSMPDFSRRDFLYGSAAGAAASVAMCNPAFSAAQSVGVKPGDLPDLTIKEIKVYVTDMTNVHRLNGTETGELISVVTHSGIEGNYTIGNRNHTVGWLDWAKSALVGKSVTDLLPTLASTSGMKGPGGFDASSFGRAGSGGEPRRVLARSPSGQETDRRSAAPRSPAPHYSHTEAARGRITTPPPQMFACGTFSARRWTGPSTRSFREGSVPGTA